MIIKIGYPGLLNYNKSDKIVFTKYNFEQKCDTSIKILKSAKKTILACYQGKSKNFNLNVSSVLLT